MDKRSPDWVSSIEISDDTAGSSTEENGNKSAGLTAGSLEDSKRIDTVRFLLGIRIELVLSVRTSQDHTAEDTEASCSEFYLNL